MKYLFALILFCANSALAQLPYVSAATNTPFDSAILGRTGGVGGHNAWITNSGGGSGSAIYFTNSATIWVDPNGNDSTAVRGFRTKSSKTITNAIALAQPGDTLMLMAGVYTLSNYITMPTNGAIVGNGSVVINNYVTTGTNIVWPVIMLSDNCEVRGITISNKIPTLYQACFGTASSAGSASFTNARVVNCFGWGDSDCWYVNHTNRCDGVVVNPQFVSHWDAGVCLNGPHTFKWFGGQLICTWPSLQSDAAGVSHSFFATSGTNIFYGTHFAAANAPTNNYGVVASGSGTRIDLNSCNINSTSTNSTAIKQIVQSSSAVINSYDAMSDISLITGTVNYFPQVIVANQLNGPKNSVLSFSTDDSFTHKTNWFGTDGAFNLAYNLAKIFNISYTWPITNAIAGQILTSDGNTPQQLSWVTVSSGGGANFWVTNTAEGGIMYTNSTDAKAVAKFSARSPGTFASGYTNGGTLYAGQNGDIAVGIAYTGGTLKADAGPGATFGAAYTSGTLESIGSSELVSGEAHNSGIIEGTGAGSIIGGYVDNSGKIYDQAGRGNLLFGEVEDANSLITAMNDYGGLAHGGAFAASTIKVTGYGALAQGEATSGTGFTGSLIWADHPGSIASGYADRSSTLQATGDGGMVFGMASKVGTITASTAGIAAGYAESNATIIASSDAAQGNGDFAFGFAGGTNSTIFAQGRGSFAVGNATNGGGVTATGKVSITFGENVGNASEGYSFAFGKNFTNNNSSNFVVGWSSTPALAVTPSGTFAKAVTASSITVTGSAPGTIVLNDANGALRAQFGTNDNLSMSNATTTLSLTLTNGGANFGSNVVAKAFYGSGANVTAIPEAGLSLTDVTTANSSTSQHGFLKKLDNNSAHYMDGTGAWSTPSGGGGGTVGNQILGGGVSSINMGTGHTYLNGVGTGGGTTSAVFGTPVVRSVTITNFSISFNVGGAVLGAGTNGTVTLQTNSVASNVVISYLGDGSAKSFSDTTHGVTVPAGTLIRLDVNAVAGSIQTPNLSWTFEAY